MPARAAHRETPNTKHPTAHQRKARACRAADLHVWGVGGGGGQGSVAAAAYLSRLLQPRLPLRRARARPIGRRPTRRRPSRARRRRLPSRKKSQVEVLRGAVARAARAERDGTDLILEQGACCGPAARHHRRTAIALSIGGPCVGGRRRHDDFDAIRLAIARALPRP